MLKYFNNRRNKGQSTLEYAILIIIIIGALLSIQVYIKRGIQGRLKQATDDIGDQFSPGNTNVNKDVHVIANTKQSSSQSTGAATKQNIPEITNETMNSQIITLNQEFWGGK